MALVYQQFNEPPSETYFMSKEIIAERNERMNEIATNARNPLRAIVGISNHLPENPAK